MKNKLIYSKNTSELNNKGVEIVTTYRIVGSNLTGFYKQVVMSGRVLSHMGTTSSGGRVPFKRLTKKMLNGYKLSE